MPGLRHRPSNKGLFGALSLDLQGKVQIQHNTSNPDFPGVGFTEHNKTKLPI